jgi:hypothetical protein
MKPPRRFGVFGEGGGSGGSGGFGIRKPFRFELGPALPEDAKGVKRTTLVRRRSYSAVCSMLESAMGEESLEKATVST